MNVVSNRSIFTAMKQNGPFAVTDEVHFGPIFTPHSRLWVKQFGHDPLTVTKYRVVRTQIFDLLQVSNFNEIHELLQNRALRQSRQDRNYTLLANLFGIEGQLPEIRNRISEYAAGADGVINYLQNNIFTDHSSSIEISNEIETTQNPVDLLLITFNNRYHKKVRFEAKRKLVLMGLAGSINQREKESDIENKFSAFLNFLNQYVWSPQLKIGELQTAYLHSIHNSHDFGCESVTVVAPDQLHNLNVDSVGEKLTQIKRRLFECDGKTIPVYVTLRKKDSAAKIIKLLRKNEKNPAVAVDDELGLMAVLDSIADIKRFMRHLSQAARRADSIIVLEDISDTLTGGQYHAQSVGSSSQTPMLKFFARLGGIRVEFIIHTNQTYLNYRYQQGIAHKEYEVRRLFDSGVAEFLFPKDIYQLDMESIRYAQLKKFRSKIEGDKGGQF